MFEGHRHLPKKEGVKKAMSGMTNEQWKRVFSSFADKAPEAFKDCVLPFSISVRNDNGTETTIYEHGGKDDDSESDN
mgnify:CR=1 FL=1